MQSDAVFKYFCPIARKWQEKPSVKASTARAFLESVKLRAGKQRAKLNQAMTRAEAWKALLDSIEKIEPEKAIPARVFKNILAEFGR
jgi:hypothetical protein